MFEIMSVAFHHEISEEDTYEVLPSHRSNKLGRQLEVYWNQELKKHKTYALHRALYRMFGNKYMMLGVCKMIEELVLVWV